jgi:hypothetical protein
MSDETVLLEAVSPLRQHAEDRFTSHTLTVTTKRVTISATHFNTHKAGAQAQRRRLIRTGTLNVGTLAEWTKLVDWAAVYCAVLPPEGSVWEADLAEFYEPANRRVWTRPE